MSSENYHKLPAFIKEISSQCKDHKNKFELYCSFHACPCCVQCVSDKHQKCQDLKALSDVLKQVKSSASVQLFKRDLEDMKENLDTAIKFLKTRISSINAQKTKAVEEIRYTRKSINDYLNNLEQDILNELESKHSMLKSNMVTVVQQMEHQSSQIDLMQSQFTIMTQYATKLQMYIGLREIEQTTSQTAKYIEDLESGDHFIDKSLEVNISSALQSISHDVKSFGNIAINTTSSILRIKSERKEQAQHFISNVPGVEQIKPSLLTRLTVPKDMKTLIIVACCILPNGKFKILDQHNKRLLLFSNDGIFIRIVVTFKSDPFDACFVRNNTVAVTLGSDQPTTLVDIEKNKNIQAIKLSHFCNGVASDGETLVVSSNDRQSTIVNLNNMSHTTIKGMDGVFRISLFHGNIYGTNVLENKVCCFDSTGKPLWTLEHQDIKHPEGITLDNNGYIYIVSRAKKSVVVVSPDGKDCKTILSATNGIRRPYGIEINKEIGMLIVSSEISEDRGNYKTAFVYKI
ncbi:Hypothetical predicted protein [Mytilus galloprovincialis]|uniref:B box-type domain-containing protein n=1 Tax=Mytilus galloprovincialis TaxID=29158 RepID=A0A8B6DA00_MYTGA|nr:Hypothetical predicted protein [Mytilus galloprovincialis]